MLVTVDLLEMPKDENFLKFLLNLWNLRDLLGSSCLVYNVTELVLVFPFKTARIMFLLCFPVLCWFYSPRNRPRKVVKKKRSPKPRTCGVSFQEDAGRE